MREPRPSEMRDVARERALMERDQYLRKLQQAVAEKDREIERLRAEVARLRRALNGDFDA